MTTKTANVNGKRRARHFSGPSVTLPRLSPGKGLRSVKMIFVTFAHFPPESPGKLALGADFSQLAEQHQLGKVRVGCARS